MNAMCSKSYQAAENSSAWEETERESDWAPSPMSVRRAGPLIRGVGAKTLFRSARPLRWAHAPKNWNMRFCAENRFCLFCGARDASKQRLAADALPYEFS